MPVAAAHLTVGDIARLKGVPHQVVRRIVDRLLPDAPRAGLYRLVPAEELPRVEEALDRAGYLSSDGGPDRAA
jgi:hypothetical protein